MKSKEALREAVFEKDMCCAAILEQSDFRKARRMKKEENETLLLKCLKTSIAILLLI